MIDATTAEQRVLSWLLRNLEAHGVERLTTRDEAGDRLPVEDQPVMAAAIERVKARLSGGDPWRELYEAERAYDKAADRYDHAQALNRDGDEIDQKHEAAMEGRYSAAVVRLDKARFACGLPLDEGEPEETAGLTPARC